jgi:uncharacterized protein YbbK (DUF523 family)
MNNYLVSKIKIGISACQFGANFRYDGKGNDITENLKREKNEFIWFPVCPEVASGLGVPRSPVSLRGGNGDDFWQGNAHIKNRDSEILDEKVKNGNLFCFNQLKEQNIDVFIFMEGSPSCGVYRTSLKGKRLGNPPGIFGSLLLKENIFLIPSVDLQSPIKWWDWRRRMYAFVWLKNQDIKTMQEIYDSWHIVKFLCQELNRKESDEIGQILANGNLSEDSITDIKNKMLLLLRKPSSIEKIKQSLWKNYSWLHKKKKINIEEVMSPTNIRNMSHIAKELVKLEVISREENLLFGASPIYRERK